MVFVCVVFVCVLLVCVGVVEVWVVLCGRFYVGGDFACGLSLCVVCICVLFVFVLVAYICVFIVCINVVRVFLVFLYICVCVVCMWYVFFYGFYMVFVCKLRVVFKFFLFCYHVFLYGLYVISLGLYVSNQTLNFVTKCPSYSANRRAHIPIEGIKHLNVLFGLFVISQKRILLTVCIGDCSHVFVCQCIVQICYCMLFFFCY